MYISAALTTALAFGLPSSLHGFNSCNPPSARIPRTVSRPLNYPTSHKRSHHLVTMMAEGETERSGVKGKASFKSLPRIMKPVHRLSVKCDHPCYINTDKKGQVYPENPSNEQQGPSNLFVTGFSFFNSHVSEVEKIDELLAAAKKADDSDLVDQSLPIKEPRHEIDQVVDTQVLAKHFHWPTGAMEVPEHIFSQARQLLIGDGFMLPGKDNGGLYRYNIETGETTRLLAPKNGWFYHKAEFMKYGDRLVMITVRTTQPILFGEKKGELIWAEPPEPSDKEPDVINGIQEGPYWKEYVIGVGADFVFEMEDLNGDGMPDIVATEYSGKQLSLFEFGGFSDTDAPQWKKSVLAKGLGELFNLQIVDLNGSGSKDILFTNHVNDQRAGVYALEQNSDEPDGWRLHTLTKGIATRRPGFGEASPGNAFAFDPDKWDLDQKPHIVVSGDGSGCAYLLIPDSQASGDWNYTLTPFLDGGQSMIGQVIAEDIDNDGIVEIGVPVYHWDSIEFFSYEPDNGKRDSNKPDNEET